MERVPLHEILCEVVGMPFPDGKNHCYFSPPSKHKMNYPCIVYNHTNDQDLYADNSHYLGWKRYTVTVIDRDPDSKIPTRLKELPYCTSDRNFSVDGLNHFVYELFYNGPRIKEDDNESND